MEKRRRKRKSKSSSSAVQKLMVLAAGIMLALCLASISYGIFLRHDRDKGGESRFRIEVLNGAGRSGLAKKAAKSLMLRGLDVLKIGNAENSYDHSVLIARKKNSDIELLGRLINCSNIMEQLQKNSLIDATLILGADYKQLNLGVDGDSGLH